MYTHVRKSPFYGNQSVLLPKLAYFSDEFNLFRYLLINQLFDYHLTCRITRSCGARIGCCTRSTYSSLMILIHEDPRESSQDRPCSAVPHTWYVLVFPSFEVEMHNHPSCSKNRFSTPKTILPTSASLSDLSEVGPWSNMGSHWYTSTVLNTISRTLRRRTRHSQLLDGSELSAPVMYFGWLVLDHAMYSRLSER